MRFYHLLKRFQSRQKRISLYIETRKDKWIDRRIRESRPERTNKKTGIKSKLIFCRLVLKINSAPIIFLVHIWNVLEFEVLEILYKLVLQSPITFLHGRFIYTRTGTTVIRELRSNRSHIKNKQCTNWAY